MSDAVVSRATAGAQTTRDVADPLPLVREAVRNILTASPAFAELEPPKRRDLAQSMVRVCQTAANLILEEMEGGGEIPVPERPLAAAQAADGDFGAAARQVAGTTRAILNAVSFPSFVTDLINGVFRAMIDSSQTQMQAYVDLLNAVAASTEGFADSNMGPGRARAWLVEHYPESFEFESSIDDEDVESMSPEEREELERERSETRVRLRPGATPPTEQALRADLGLEPNESVPAASSPESGLVPLVRRRLSKMRQEMLATLVQMGMQRIVVDSGRITASMRFHIDTRDAVARDQGSRFGTEHELSGSGSFGIGAWGASASAKSNISYVSTQKSQSTQELNTDLDLNSSVEINFRSDYVPLNRLASPGQSDAIRANSRNPAAEERAAEAEREKRLGGARESERRRYESVDAVLRPSSSAPSPAPPRPAPGASPEGGAGAGSPASGGPASGGRGTTPAGGSTAPRGAAPPPPPPSGTAHRTAAPSANAPTGGAARTPASPQS